MRPTIREHVNLAPLTTLKIGGPARFFVTAEAEADVVEALRFAGQNSLETFVLGGGSNLLVADAGFDGLVIHIDLTGVSANVDGTITAQAGEDWDAFVEHAVSRDLAGVECLSGIPGRVGGTPIQNVGAYGQDVSETIKSVRCLDRRDNSFVELSNAECGFSYRKSRFNADDAGHFVVLAVTYQLRHSREPKVAYKDLQEYFGGRQPTLFDVRQAVLEIRRAKSMVIDAADVNSTSAGSFFKNPVVSRAKFDTIAAEFANVPSFAAGDEMVKIPAAWLIENAGFPKGFSLERAGISANHTLALINRGGATAAEIIALKNLIQETVMQKFDVELTPEPVFIGF